MRINKDKVVENIKAKFEENPVEVIGAAALAITATAKLLQAGTNASNSRTWKKEVRRREMMQRFQ